MIKLVLIILLLFPVLSHAEKVGRVQVYGCAPEFNPPSAPDPYCAPVPVGTKNVPGFDLIQDDKTVSVPLSTDVGKQPGPKNPPPLEKPKQSICTTGHHDSLGPEQGALGCRWRLRQWAVVSPSMPGACRAYAEAQMVDYSNCPGGPGFEMVTMDMPGTDQLTCPKGYQEIQGACKITSERAISDNQQDISTGTIAGGPIYKPVEDDIDNKAPIADRITTAQPAPNKIVIPTKSQATGQPMQATGTITNTGSSIEIQTVISLPSGLPGIRTTRYTFNVAGDHVGTSIVNEQGTMGGGTTANGGDGTYTSTATSGGGIGAFPNDYAKTGEALAAANVTGQKIDDIKKALTEQGQPGDSGEGAPPTFENPIAGAFGGILGGLVPAHTGTCPTVQFTLWDHVFTMDAQCTIAESNRTIIQFSSLAFWALAALFIVLGA